MVYYGVKLLYEVIVAALRTRLVPALFDGNSVIEEPEKNMSGNT